MEEGQPDHTEDADDFCPAQGEELRRGVQGPPVAIRSSTRRILWPARTSLRCTSSTPRRIPA